MSGLNLIQMGKLFVNNENREAGLESFKEIMLTINGRDKVNA